MAGFRLILLAQVGHLVGDALHPLVGDLTHIVGGGDVPGSGFVVALAAVGGHRLVGTGRHHIPHHIGADHLPLHVGQVQRHPVLCRGRRDIGHIVAVQRADGLGGGHRTAAGGVARRLCADAGVIQGQGARPGAVVILHGGGQLLQDHVQVFLSCLHRHRLGVGLALGHPVVLLHDVRVGIEKALQLEGLLDQRLGIHLGGNGVGLDHLLAAVEVLHHRIGGHLQGAGAHGQRRRQQQAKAKFFHWVQKLLSSNWVLE